MKNSANEATQQTQQTKYPKGISFSQELSLANLASFCLVREN